jgi:hypothetical protein
MLNGYLKGSEIHRFCTPQAVDEGTQTTFSFDTVAAMQQKFDDI